MSIFGHGFPGVAEFAYRQKNRAKFSWSIDDVQQLNAGAFNNARVEFFTCNSATSMETGKSLGYVFSLQTGSLVTGYIGKSTYAHMNNGENLCDKILRAWYGFNPNGSVRLPQKGEGAKKILYIPTSCSK